MFKNGRCDHRHHHLIFFTQLTVNGKLIQNRYTEKSKSMLLKNAFKTSSILNLPGKRVKLKKRMIYPKPSTIESGQLSQ